MINTLDQLSLEEKRELLKRLLRERGAAELRRHQLSHGQHALWLLHQLAPGSATHHVAFAVRVRSPITIDALNRALRTLAERHGALRTRFSSADGTPLQEVLPQSELRLEEIDVRHLDAEAVRRRVEASYARPFDLGTAPLLRVVLHTCADDDHVLLLTVHHAIADYWSVVVLVTELFELYAAACEGRPASLSEPPPPFVEHVDATRQALGGPEGQRSWEHWRESLTGAPPPAGFAGSAHAGANRSWAGATCSFDIDADCTTALRALARAEGVTLFVVLLSAFYVLLGRHSGADDLVVGSLASGRTRTRFRDTVGYFVNSIALRVRLDDDPTFSELLQRTRSTTVDALRHQDFPFPLVVERLHPKRAAALTVLFRTLFVLQNLPIGDDVAALAVGRPGTRVRAAGLDLESFPLAQQEGEFELELEITALGDTLACAIKYRADLLSAAEVDGLARRYTRLLKAVAEAPDRRVSALPMLDDVDIREQLVEWNRTDRPLPRDRRVTDWLRDHARAQPLAAALTESGRAVSYAELCSRVDRMAGRLAAAGVGPDTLVAIYSERGVDLITALLAVHAAGGAFLALDPRHPPERNVRLIESSAARLSVIAASARHAEDLRTALHDAAVGDLDSMSADGGDPHCDPPTAPPPVDLGDLAYVVFTSGSTGEPKGALLEVRGLINHLLAKVEDLALAPGDVVAQTASMAFDISVWQCLAAIVAGATTAVVDDEAAIVPERLVASIEAQRITVLELVPSMLRLLVRAAAADGHARDVLARLRFLLSTGEALPVELCREWFALGLNVPVVNAYGPTECSDDVTHAFIEAAPPMAIARMPIGRPIRNTRLYVLGPRGELLPRGASGELYVGGAGVGRGYLGDPERTHVAFVPDPFGADTGARLYRTGDRVRWLPDGSLELLGRVDDQIKLRGYRIEPGEIEHTLETHPTVEAAAVVLRRSDSDEPELVAYIVAREPSVSFADLKTFLRSRLPDAMVPQRYVRLDSFPTTSNGKIDRGALPAPDASPAPPFVAPRTEVEAAIAAIWLDVLGRERVSVEDDFFDIGGHSLAITQITFRIRERFHVDVPLVRTFDRPTIAGLSAIVEELLLERRAPAGARQPRDASPRPSIASEPASAYFTFERRPLAGLVRAGELPPVEAASLSYLPDAMLAHTGLDRAAIVDGLFGGRPYVSSLLDTPLGRIACLVLPRFASECYGDDDALRGDCERALELAGTLGARVASLGGILASATDYGRRIGGSHSVDGGLRLSTGHATTAAAVVRAVARLLRETGRDLARERVAFIGLGSVGSASLRLMLQRLPHPESLMLCEVYQRREAIADLHAEVRDRFGFAGGVRCLTSHRDVSAEAYGATLIVGATNVPDVLDVSRLGPGTLLVDDSAPHCFSLRAAARRLASQRDLLFTEGGTLQFTEPFHSTCYFPENAEHVVRMSPAEVAATLDPREITGCVVSPLLSVRRSSLVPVLGVPELAACDAHFDALSDFGLEPTPLRGRGDALGEVFVPSADDIARFRDRFGARP